MLLPANGASGPRIPKAASLAANTPPRAALAGAPAFHMLCRPSPTAPPAPPAGAGFVVSASETACATALEVEAQHLAGCGCRRDGGARRLADPGLDLAEHAEDLVGRDHRQHGVAAAQPPRARDSEDAPDRIGSGDRPPPRSTCRLKSR